MSAPRLTRRMRRLVPVRVPDGAGGRTRSWEAGGAFWASVSPGGGGARVTELGTEPRLRLRIVTQALPEGHPTRPVPGDRLAEGARLYAVDAVDPADGEGRWLTLFAREITERGTP